MMFSFYQKSTRALTKAKRLLGFLFASILFFAAPIQAFAAEGSSSWDAFWGTLAGGADFVFGNILEWIAGFVFHITAWILSVAGYLLDISIQTSISSSTYNSITAINTVWDVVRDFANMFFLFGLIYIAIMTILNAGNYKRYIATIIIAALFVNFSLFFTKVIVDVANVFTVYFWNTASQAQINGATVNSLSGVFMEAFQLQTTSSAQGSANTFDVTGLSNTNRAIAYIFGAVAMLVATFVFLSGAIMFILRTIAIIFLMVLSPLAFVAAALPGLRGHASRWWGSLMSHAFFAPVFMFFIYLVAEIARNNSIGAVLGGLGGSIGSAISTAITGQATATNLAPIFSYILILGLLIGAIVAAKSIAGNLASSSTKWAKIGMGAAYGTAGGMILRNTAGRGFAAAANSNWMKGFGERSNFGAWAERKAQGLSSASYDFRGVKGVGGYGKTRGQGGFVKAREQDAKMYEEQGKRLGKDKFGNARNEILTKEMEYKYRTYDKDGKEVITTKTIAAGQEARLLDKDGYVVQKKGKGGIMEDQYRTGTDVFADRLKEAPVIPGTRNKLFSENGQGLTWPRSRWMAKRLAAQKLAKKEKSIRDTVKEAIEEEEGGGDKSSEKSGGGEDKSKSSNPADFAATMDV